MEYRPDIDGLRAVAVSAAVLFHAGTAPFAGSYVGVDIFFVISGFLITSILRGNLEAGQFSLWTFYAAQARRIMPALIAMTGYRIRKHIFQEVGGAYIAASVNRPIHRYRTHLLFPLSLALAPPGS